MTDLKPRNARQRKRLIFPVILVLFALGIILTVSQRNSEPRYEGIKLSAWIDDFNESRSNTNSVKFRNAERAIQEIGTNAIPQLLKWMNYQDTPVATKVFQATYRKYPKLASFLVNADDYSRSSSTGFLVLGEKANVIVPELWDSLEYPDNKNNNPKYIAALAAIGTQEIMYRFQKMAGSTNVFISREGMTGQIYYQFTHVNFFEGNTQP